MSALGRQRIGVTTAKVADTPARVLLALVRGGTARRRLLSALGLALAAVLGAGYLVFGALGMDPSATTISVRVHLAQSGGLLAGQNVTLRGVPVGHVQSIDLKPGGVIATAVVDAATQIPNDGMVSVASLSTAGEQYLDFSPNRNGGPFLTDGEEISVERTETPVPLWEMLSSMDKTLAQIDSEQLATIVDELGVSPQGPRKLADIIDGGTFLISTLDSVLPQTVGLLQDSKTTLDTVGEGSEGLADFAKDASALTRGVEAKTGGYVEMLRTAPNTLGALDAVMADNSGALDGLMANLTTVADKVGPRAPAFQEFFFPQERDGSTLDALTSIIHDGGIWGLVNLYPRYSCDYGLPRLPPSRPDHPEPYLYTFCPNDDPSVLVRGARNAPRPPGEQAPTERPPGEPADRTANPAPVGPQTIPLPGKSSGEESSQPR